MDLLIELLPIVLIAALAQTVNQSMGMGYGVITSSLLLTSGMPPAVISATVHAAEVGTSASGAMAHWRLGNVDRRMAFVLAVPGAAGGFFGVVVLASLPVEVARPGVGAVLVALGVLILMRFANPRRSVLTSSWRTSALAPLAAVAGTLDATGGGGWGPVATGTLMSRPPAAVRIVIGTVNAAGVATTVGATAGFVVASGFDAFHVAEIVALMVGGVAVSVPAALLAKRVRSEVLGVAVGTLLVSLNVRTIAVALDWEATTIATAMVFAAVGSIGTVSAFRRSYARREAARIAPPHERAVPVEVLVED